MFRPAPLLALAIGLFLVNPSHDAHAQGPAPPMPPHPEGRATLVPASEIPLTAPPSPHPREVDARRAGFRNPGGVGRTLEYYPPGNRFQNEGRGAIMVPRFGGYPAANSRAMQLQAQRVGIERSAALQHHIDAYGQPLRFFWIWPGVAFWP